MNKLIIGIAGYAGAGKDFLAKELKKELESLGYSVSIDHFAKTLKEECRNFCLDHFSIDPISCTREDKEKIRDILIGVAKTRRKITDGKYWVEKLDSRLPKNENEIILIPDTRHAFYKEDECQWIQEKNKGLVVHVSRYSESFNNGIYKRDFVKAPNDEEKFNDELVKKRADYCFSWEDFKHEKSHEKYIHSLVQWLINRRVITIKK